MQVGFKIDVDNNQNLREDMINRVLIRTKVVQLLYSYLLVENRFEIESQPMPPTKEKRFAYALYLDMLCLMVKIAGEIKQRGGHAPLYDTRFIKRVSGDEKIRGLLQKYRMEDFPLEGAVDNLVATVKESGLYKKFVKGDDNDYLAGEKIWQEIYDTIIKPDPTLNRLISSRENYTLGGVERMNGMMADTFKNFYSSTDDLPNALRTLKVSMEKAQELYFRLLWLPVQIVQLREREIDEARARYTATAEDRNPNLRFVENEYVAFIRDNESINDAMEKYGRNMSIDDEPMLKALLRAIMASDIYQEYMEFPATDFENDCEFWKNIYKQVIFLNPDFLEALEDKSVFWNDDLDTIGTFVLKTVKRISEKQSFASIMTPYKDEEDAKFGAQLFEYVINDKEEYRGYIESALDNKLWDSDRLAFMDIVILMTALAEILNYPKIPLTVSINEYVEIAKAYSTRKSGQFVHGLLAAVLKRLKEEGILLKSLSKE